MEVAECKEDAKNNEEAAKENTAEVVGQTEESQGHDERMAAQAEEVATFMEKTTARNNGLISVLNKYLLAVVKSQHVRWVMITRLHAKTIHFL